MALLAHAAVSAQVTPDICGALANGYGPFDYRTHKPDLVKVERHHFTAQVENLLRGQEGSIGGDLDYTLRASPNHLRALVSMMRYGERLKVDKVPGANFLVECYFERALRYRADDTSARMLYATFLHRKGRMADAERQMEAVVQRAGDDPFVHYNAGMVYLEMKDFDRALQRAHVAEGMGLRRPGLREQLAAAGKWRDPAPATTDTTATPKPDAGGTGTRPDATGSARPPG